MSNSSQSNPNDQEIDLGLLSKKIGNSIQSFIDRLFDGILFLQKNIVVLGILVIVGTGMGIFLDVKTKLFNHEIIVASNFGSTDYLYSKIFQINSKIKENDTLFLKQIGIKNTKQFRKIEIEPIPDIYGFISENEKNFEMIKLMAEDGDLKKIVDDKLTSKNYPFHLISFITKNKTDEDKTLKPLLNYLNQNDYYEKLQKENINNIQIKIKENDSIISQINDVMRQFSNTSGGNQKSDKLVYYNENTQLNEVLKTKELLINEQGENRLDLIKSDKIIKETSHILNVKNTENTRGKLKLILPILLVVLFILFSFFKRFYKKQMAKRNLA